jgi:hypothetical protein
MMYMRVLIFFVEGIAGVLGFSRACTGRVGVEVRHDSFRVPRRRPFRSSFLFQRRVWYPVSPGTHHKDWTLSVRIFLTLDETEDAA